jgi:hypothetical protein
MAKKNRNNNNQKANNSQTTTQATAAKIDNLQEQATNNVTEADLNAIQSETPPANINLEDIWKKADEARQLFEAQEKRLKAEADKAEKLKQELEIEEISLDNLREELSAKQEELNRQLNDVQTREKQLLKKERDLKERELNAEADFAAENRAALANLDGEAQVLRDELSQLRKTISEERATSLNNLEGELARKRAEFEENVEAKNREIESEKQSLADEKKRLKRESRNLELERELLEEEREALNDKIERKVAAKLEEYEGKFNAYKEALQLARKERDRLQSVLIRKEEAQRKFGHKTPEEVLQEIEILQQKKDELERQLARRPGEDATERLRELESKQEAWETEKSQLKREMGQLKHQLTNSRIAVTEVEDLRDEKETLLASRSLLQTAIEELKAQVNELTSKVEGKSAFPACATMDENKTLQTESSLSEAEIPDLATFAEEVRHRIAAKELYYSPRDIRVFLGGLAASKLHILQGISGTGKTSLPLAFARAVRGGSTLVEVQAGWRDRQDLIGHFNAFEGKFYESEFLQGLYKAQCPSYREKIYLIVLDEMNLSRPEQYFADFLSKLEQPKPELDLMTAPVEPAPRLLREGRKLPIPDNVWFVGTANHDETTLEFADKTYDRAHVMELPRNRERFEPAAVDSSSPISYEALKKAFDKAKSDCKDSARQTDEFLHTIEDTLSDRFRVGWGNRLQRQIEDFVPVVVASGGSLGEATDHILATKILRKVRDRYDTQADDLRQLQDDIESVWLDEKNGPVRSLEIINNELRRLGE